MTPFRLRGTLPLLLLLSLASSGYCREQPNFVMCYIDDLGWSDVGFNGSQFYLTPNIDRLCKQGMKFTSGYSNGPNCAPSRACFMSGQYSPRHGVYTVGNPARGQARARRLIPIPNKRTLWPRIVTLAESLRRAGYATAHMGKWHLGTGPTGPLKQGFDLNIGGNRSGAPRGGYFSPYRNPQLKNGPQGEYLTDRLTDEAIKWIEQNKTQQKPFFLYLAHYAVHTPIQAKQALVAKYRKRKPSRGQKNPRYAAMIESVDQSVGRILATLRQLKLARQTLIVFYSDNGGYAGATSNYPLRGAKGTLYEGGIRVPLAIRWLGTIEPGTTCDLPVSGVDFYPTLIELAGAKMPAGQPYDGRSIVPLLKGQQPDDFRRRELHWHFPAYLQGRVQGSRDPLFRTRPGAVLRRGNWKLIEYFEDGQLELYNLGKDRGEKRNLINNKPELARELHSRMKLWRKKINAPIPRTPNPQFDPKFKRRRARGPRG